jgi:hypothetical protein
MPWGEEGTKKGGYGLAHILRRRQEVQNFTYEQAEDFVRTLPKIITEGSLDQDKRNDRIFIKHSKNNTVIRLIWDNTTDRWLASAYPESPGSRRTSVRAQTDAAKQNPSANPAASQNISQLPEGSNIEAVNEEISGTSGEGTARSDQAGPEPYSVLDSAAETDGSTAGTPSTQETAGTDPAAQGSGAGQSKVPSAGGAETNAVNNQPLDERGPGEY